MNIHLAAFCSRNLFIYNPIYICPVFFEESRSGPSGVGFSPDAALRFAVLFAGFLRYDNRTIMKSFLKKIAREFSGNFVGFLCKFPVNS